jgi:hypothetical protein
MLLTDHEFTAELASRVMGEEGKDGICHLKTHGER